MALIGKQQEVTVGGETFILQHPGVRKALQIQDDTRDQAGRSSEAMASELLKHVIFLKEADGMPKSIDLDYFEKFDSIKVLSELVAEASKFVFR